MTDKSQDLIAQLIDDLDAGAMVTKFVVVAEGIDMDGASSVYA